jgi:serine/threonine-protein kinase
MCKRDVDTPGRFCPFCGASAPPVETSEDPVVGSTIANKYFVNQFLGRGGMGQVYKGTDLVLERPVAIKVLNKALSNDSSMVQRFHREARAASRLNHPNCITILDFGQTEDERFYIAMEFLAGRSLAKLLADEFPLGQARAVRIVAQVLAGLGEAHANDIVHRDLKLANVMVETRRDEPDFVKVLDFGIAKLNGAGDGGLTGTGMVCGTPGYMSPEQARGEAIDGRSDLYAVGVLLYELLTGVLPFESATPMGQLTKHLTETPVSPIQRRPELGIAPDLDALVLRALSKSPADRWPTAEAMRESLLICELPAGAPSRFTPKPAPRATAFISAASVPVAPEPKESPPAPGVPGLRHIERSGAPARRSHGPAHAEPGPGTTMLPRVDTLPPGPRAIPATTAVGPPAPATPAPTAPAAPAAAGPAGPTTGTAMLPQVAAPSAANLPAPSRATPPPEAPVQPSAATLSKALPAERSSRPAPPPRKSLATSKVAIGAGAGLVLVVASIWLFRSDPYAPPAAAPKEEAGLTLGRQPDPARPVAAVPTPAPAPAKPVEAAPTPAPPPARGATPAPTPAPRAAPPPHVAAAPPAAAPPVAPPRKGAGLVEVVEGMNLIKSPPPTSGQGILTVTASPWGVASVDGKELGETPREARLGEGYYRVRVTHPTLGVKETTVVVPPGKRVLFNARFTK